MLPMPTRTAAIGFAGLLSMIAVGIALQSAPPIWLASAGLVGLATVLATSMPLARRVRRQQLEFAWWLDHGTALSGTVVPGAPFDVRCYVRHRGHAPLFISELSPVVPRAARVLSPPRTLAVRPRAATEFTFRLLAPAAGRVVLHGLAVTLRGPLGLFQVPLYFPNPLAVKVLPRAAALTRGGARSLTSAATSAGQTILRQRGGGTELHELRELLPGDPYKSIAWKASARRGKLMVREVEQEVQDTRWVVLDVSGTMRGGELGSRKLDFGIEASAAAARHALENGDRVGLYTVDGRVVSRVTPGDRKAQMLRVYDALLAATEVVDEDLTELDDDELARVVARYIRQQDGVDYQRRADRVVDVGGLVAHIRRTVELDPAPAIASSPAHEILRRFCRTRGVPLPYRPDPRERSKARGLCHVLKEIAAPRTPSLITIITDLDGLYEHDELCATLRVARARGHRVAFVVPDARRFATVPSSRLARDLEKIYGALEERRTREATRIFGRLGVPVTLVGPGDPPSLVMSRAHRVRSWSAA